MKSIAFLVLIFSLPSVASPKGERKYIPPSGISRSQSDWGGISKGSTNTSQEEVRRKRAKAGSMGGAPNAGGGTGTGTGAGSTVGHGTGRGVTTAGATSGENDE